MDQSSSPPHISINDKVILFDGVCKLCNAWSSFIIRHDRDQVFKLCSVQSKEGKDILGHFNLPLDYFETMLYVENNQSFEKSDAFLMVVKHLPAPWRYLNFLKYLPKIFSDWLYDRIALNRYNLFGKYDQCVLPSPDHNARFLGND